MLASDLRRSPLAAHMACLIGLAMVPAPTAAQTVSDGAPLSVGQAVDGVFRDTTPTYGGRGRFHLFHFRAAEGDRFVVELESPNFDTFLVVGHRHAGLFDPLSADDDGGEGTNSRLRFIAPRSGTYLVVAQALRDDAVGLYTLRLDTLPAPGPLTPVDLPIDGIVQGELTFDDPVLPGEGTAAGYDLFALRVEAGGRYMVAVDSDELDTVLDVGPLGGDGLADVTWTDDDGGYGSNSRIVFTAQATAEYGVRVRAFGSGLGHYTVRSARLDTRPPAEPITITAGAMVAGELDYTDSVLEDGGYFDLFAFRGRAGETVRISLESEAFDAFLTVGTPGADGGFETITSDDDGGEGTNAMVELVLPEAGEYHVRVESLNSGQIGPYRIALTNEQHGG